MTAVVLMSILHIAISTAVSGASTDEQGRQQLSLSLSLSLSPLLISPITFHFNSGLFGVTSDTGHHLVGTLSSAGTQSCRSPISLHTRGSYESVERSTFYPEQHNIVVLMRQPASRSQKGPLLQKGGGLQTPGFCMNYVPVTSSRILCSPLPLSARTAPTTLPSNPKVTNTRDS